LNLPSNLVSAAGDRRPDISTVVIVVRSSSAARHRGRLLTINARSCAVIARPGIRCRPGKVHIAQCAPGPGGRWRQSALRGAGHEDSGHPSLLNRTRSGSGRCARPCDRPASRSQLHAYLGAEPPLRWASVAGVDPRVESLGQLLIVRSTQPWAHIGTGCAVVCAESVEAIVVTMRPANDVFVFPYLPGRPRPLHAASTSTLYPLRSRRGREDPVLLETRRPSSKTAAQPNGQGRCMLARLVRSEWRAQGRIGMSGGRGCRRARSWWPRRRFRSWRARAALGQARVVSRRAVWPIATDDVEARYRSNRVFAQRLETRGLSRHGRRVKSRAQLDRQLFLTAGATQAHRR